jgi:hypothetical protein
MSSPSSLTLQYNALLSSTLFNYRRKLEDNISATNALWFFLKKKTDGAYEEVSDLGERMAVPLMYQLGNAAPYSGYDILDMTPTDGITTSFWEWVQASASIVISGREKKLNRGEAKIISLLETKTKQAEMALQEGIGKWMQQGNGPNSATAIQTPYTNPLNGATFVEPLPKLIAYDPTTSLTVGNINQSTYTWWRNRTKNSTAGSFAAFRKELRALYNDCKKGPGGGPGLHLVDQATHEMYEMALESFHRNDSWKKADIPFENVLFRGHPVIWDEWVPDVQGGSITQSTTSGTWQMIHTDFLKLKVDKQTNFHNTPFQRPDNQDAESAQILWLGSLGTSHRRKHGVMGGIDTTLTS